MKKDIHIPTVEGVQVVIAREKNELNQDFWQVYLINKNDFPIGRILITSQGFYGEGEEEVKTSVLRHFIDDVEAKSYALIEPIDESVFRLNNEYWVSYWVDNQLFDKRFLFVPDSIVEANLTYISILEKEGILHE